jgi:AraC-like DNA-binding protein
MRANTENTNQEDWASQNKQPKVWENLFFPKEHVLRENKVSDALIFFVIKGNITISFNENKYYNIHSKEMFLIPAGCSYCIKTLVPVHTMICRFSIDSLYSEQKLIDRLIPFCDDNMRSDCFSKLAINKQIMRFLTLLDDTIKDGLNSSYFFDIKKNELNQLLFVYYTRKELARFLHSIISGNIQFKKFVLDNYLSVKNVRELAELANYSTSGFIKKFQKNFNESPYGWMQKQKAKQILTEINKGTKSLQEIANEYKFSSYQHFAGFCKIQLGFPPTKIYGKDIFGKDI